MEVIIALVNAGANVNAKNRYGDTPLHIAADWNEIPEAIMFLLKAGADGKIKIMARKLLLNAQKIIQTLKTPPPMKH